MSNADTEHTGGSYPLTPVQEGMLFNAESAPGSGVDLAQTTCTVDADIDPGRLERTWRTLIERHPLLRTTYVAGEAVESPAGSVPADVGVIDWREAPAGDPEARLARFMEEERRRDFALSVPPLVRLSLLRERGGRSTLVLTRHHILFDGWTSRLLTDDILSAYEAMEGGAETPDLTPRADFRTYVNWLGTLDHAASRPFWQAYLDGFREPTPLPHESRGAPHAVAHGRYGRVERNIPPDLLERLRRLAQSSGVRVTTLFHAAWGLMLARHSGKDEGVFGETRACRSGPLQGIAGMLGCFINTIPLRVRVQPDREVGEWLAEIDRDRMPAGRYECTPLASIREWAGLPGDRPMFNSILVYNARSLDSVMRSRSGPLRVLGCTIFAQTNFPLVLEVEGDTGLVMMTYMSDRFSGETVARLIDGYLTLLGALPGSGPVGELPVMTPLEEQRILRDWNLTDDGVRPLPCIHELFTRQAMRTPDAVAARCGTDRLTYAELERTSRLMAGTLSALGARPGIVVAIALERSCAMMVALLAVLRSGAAYLPLDLSLPQERLRFMTKDAGCTLILTSAGVVPRLEGCAGSIIDIGGMHTGGERQPAQAGPDDPAYIMYTSGSTGKPKGIVVLHRGLSNYVVWAAKEYPFREGIGSLVHTSIAFDLTVTGLYPPLLCGKEVHLLPDSASPEDIVAALLARPGYSVVKITPAHIDMLTALLPAGGAAGLAKALVIGGSALRGESLRRWREEAPGTGIFNEYGPTETVVGCCVYRLPDGPPEAGPVPIGRPIANTRLYITDGSLRPVPVGAAGELCIAGEGVAAGYVNRPELSAAKFVPDRFSADRGARLYRTGDRARYRPDGTIEYMGREDDQVKVRGYRVEPGEIEAVLLGHRTVREAAVIPREDGSGEFRLEAYCVPSSPGHLDAEALRAHAREFLPGYMIPAVIAEVDALPLTSRGKVDKRALASREPRPAAPGPACALTGTEESLASLWMELLGVQEVSGTDNFFERGGHSLLVMRLISRIHALWNVDIGISEVFTYPTVSAMAALIERRSQGDPGGTPGDHPPGATRIAGDARPA